MQTLTHSKPVVIFPQCVYLCTYICFSFMLGSDSFMYFMDFMFMFNLNIDLNRLWLATDSLFIVNAILFLCRGWKDFPIIAHRKSESWKVGSLSIKHIELKFFYFLLCNWYCISLLFHSHKAKNMLKREFVNVWGFFESSWKKRFFFVLFLGQVKL